MIECFKILHGFYNDGYPNLHLSHKTNSSGNSFKMTRTYSHYDLWKNLFSNSIVSVLQKLTRWSKYCRSVNCSKNTSDEYWSKQDFKYDYRASTPAAGYKYNNTI